MPDLLELFREDMRSKRGRPREIAEATGIPIRSLYKILYGQTKNPGFETVEKLRPLYRERLIEI